MSDQGSSPFTDGEDLGDQALALAAGAGDASALDQLVRRHQRWIYNLALRFLLNPDDAADLAQEALIRILTRIGQFEGRSAFRTWAYRIVVNTFLDAKKGRLEPHIVSFESYGDELDAMPLEPLRLDAEFEPERRLIVKETKIGCMLGMLLCLSREQRLTYIIGEIFAAPSSVGGELFGISAAAFRKRLERARSDLTHFMDSKCGLIEKSNPCRCEKKTSAFIEAGWVDPRQRRFVDEKLEQVKDVAPRQSKSLDGLLDGKYAELFRRHPSYVGPDLAARLGEILQDPEMRQTFDLRDDGRLLE